MLTEFTPRASGSDEASNGRSRAGIALARYARRMRPAAAALLIAAFGLPARNAAAVSVSTVGGESINLDTRFGGPSQSFTTIDSPAPRITEGAAGDISAGAATIVINAPAGFAFSVVSTPSANVIAGDMVINNVAFVNPTVFPSQIFVDVATASTVPSTIEFVGIQIRPNGCTAVGNHNVGVTTDAGGAGDLNNATLITLTLLPGPSIAGYSLASDSPEVGGTPITVTISALDGCGNRIPDAVVPSDITLAVPVTGTVTWTSGAPFVLSNVNVVPDTATIAAGSVFDATGRGTFAVTNNQTCAENTTVAATHAGGPGAATPPLPISWTDANTDTDGDGVVDCNDACAATAACASVDQTGCPTDGDADGVFDGCDTCPNTFAGDAVDANGCSTADEDGDGVLNDADACRGTPACALADVGVNGCPADADADGIFDGCDQCPGANDLSDTDADGIPNCLDACPAVGDTDGDGVQDCEDGCAADPLKISPGACGCGTPDTDTDADGIANCDDACPTVGDTDGDGVQDCEDGCPNDAQKLDPGACGCGNLDTDTDGDGVADCDDGCANDALKISPGACGCGTADTDGDGDGVPDCEDGCPNDAQKLDAGACGCGNADTDSDADGVVDCDDNCANTPACASVDSRGCPTDGDDDGVADGCDDCPGTAAGDDVNADGCSTEDEDGDGVTNDADICPGTPTCARDDVDAVGCPEDDDGDSVPDGCDQCPDADDLADADGDGVPDCLTPTGRICGLGFQAPTMLMAAAFVLWPRRRRRRGG